MTEHVRTSIENGVLRVTLARPDKKNALTNAMYALLGETLSRAETDASVRVVLFDAEGDAFTAGNDLGDFAAVASGALKREDMKAHLFLNAIAAARKPYVAAVQGLAVGIGVTMLLHFDLVFVAEDAKLSLPFVDLGLVPKQLRVCCCRHAWATLVRTQCWGWANPSMDSPRLRSVWYMRPFRRPNCLPKHWPPQRNSRPSPWAHCRPLKN